MKNMILKLYRPVMILMFLLGGISHCMWNAAVSGVLCLCAAAFCLCFPLGKVNAAVPTQRAAALCVLEVFMLLASALQAIHMIEAFLD